MKEDYQPTKGGVKDEAKLVPNKTWVEGLFVVTIIVRVELMGGVLAGVEL